MKKILVIDKEPKIFFAEGISRSFLREGFISGTQDIFWKRA